MPMVPSIALAALSLFHPTNRQPPPCAGNVFAPLVGNKFNSWHMWHRIDLPAPAKSTDGVTTDK